MARTNTEMRWLEKRTSIPFTASKWISEIYYFANEESMNNWIANWEKGDHHEYEKIYDKGKCWFNDKGLLCPCSPTMHITIAKDRLDRLKEMRVF